MRKLMFLILFCASLHAAELPKLPELYGELGKSLSLDYDVLNSTAEPKQKAERIAEERDFMFTLACPERLNVRLNKWSYWGRKQSYLSNATAAELLNFYTELNKELIKQKR